MGDILKLLEITKNFKGYRVINGVDLDLTPGEKHALIGPNGSGKTTLFNLITGRYRPTKGKIFFKEKRIDGLSPYKIARQGIARSFQVTNIFNEMTVAENLRNAVVSRHDCSLKFHGLLKRMHAIKEDVDYLLDLIGLRELKDESAGTLAYGQQRALEMGIAIALDPELVLLDEPTAGMTPEETSQIVHLIRQITEKKSLLIVEHDMQVVFNLADRISVLHHGRIIATGQPDEIRSNAQVREAYLGGFFQEEGNPEKT